MDGNALQVTGVGGGPATDGEAILLRLSLADGSQTAVILRTADLAGFMLHVDSLAASALERHKQRRRGRTLKPALAFDVAKVEGQSADGAPQLRFVLASGLPLAVNLAPVDIVALHNWLTSHRASAARHIEQAERDRERGLADDPAEEPAALSSTAKLLSR